MQTQFTKQLPSLETATELWQALQCQAGAGSHAEGLTLNKLHHGGYLDLPTPTKWRRHLNSTFVPKIAKFWRLGWLWAKYNNEVKREGCPCRPYTRYLSQAMGPRMKAVARIDLQSGTWSVRIASLPWMTPHIEAWDCSDSVDLAEKSTQVQFFGQAVAAALFSKLNREFDWEGPTE